LFATGARMASQSLLSQQAVISKVYFPRLIVPITSVATALVDFAQGQSALVTAEVTLDEPRVSLLILGNHGSMQFTDFPLRPPIGAGPAGLRSALRDSLSKGEAVDAR
jgi:hypothetical protein